MKRVGNLIEQIAATENIERAYWLAQRGKANRNEVQAYREYFVGNTYRLQEQILTGHADVGHYRLFKIYDPKERVICAAPFVERVLHHAIISVCLPYFERHLIDNTFACRTGKGTYKALEQAQVYQKKYKYFLKLDVRKYFDSIHHDVLKAKLRRLFKDKRLLCLCDDIINSYPFEHKLLPAIDQTRGLPIGNLTSQFFANYYLSFADHYIKETLRVPAYVRYMDDMVLWSNDKAELLEAGKLLQTYLADELRLELKPFFMGERTTGLPFLGYRIFPTYMTLQQKRKQRFTQKWWEYAYYLNKGEWSQEDYVRHMQPLCTYAMHAETRGLRNKLLNVM